MQRGPAAPFGPARALAGFNAPLCPDRARAALHRSLPAGAATASAAETINAVADHRKTFMSRP
jgi:hypothetical protein